MLPSRYILQGPGQTGGFGSVTRARDAFLDRDVMFKSMQNHALNDQLVNEVIALSRARSKHVVEIYDVIKDSAGQLVGIIIEPLDGKTYDAFHKQSASNPTEFLRTTYQIACAITDLHAAGIIHRDLKLDNLRDSSEGVLKVFDFGLSTSLPDYITQNNRGTLVYAAPEMYVSGAVITKEMDIYALGICCWALASLRLPNELIERPPQQTKRATSINSVMGGTLDQRTISIIDSCLDVNPLNRPSAETVRNTLHAALISDKHRGRFNQGNRQVFELSAASRFVRISFPNKGALEVRYSGYEFRITGISGDVMINRMQARQGQDLPEACVLTFGSQQTGRSFVTFSSSHPEIVI